MSETKTLKMQLTHVLFEMDSLVIELRSSANGERSKKYYDFFANLLETRLKTIRLEISRLEYQEVD